MSANANVGGPTEQTCTSQVQQLFWNGNSYPKRQWVETENLAFWFGHPDNKKK